MPPRRRIRDRGTNPDDEYAFATISSDGDVDYHMTLDEAIEAAQADDDYEWTRVYQLRGTVRVPEPQVGTYIPYTDGIFNGIEGD